MLTDLRLEIDDPDAVIRPDVSEFGLLDVVDIHQLARLGEKAVDAALPDLRKAVSWTNRLRIALGAGKKSAKTG